MDHEYEFNCGMLRQFDQFTELADVPPFVYRDHEEIHAVIEAYDLLAVTGDGDQFGRVLKLMGWLKDKATYNGMTEQKPTANCRDLLSYALESKDHGINCRMLATVLSELLIGLRMRSRIVSLHSISPNDGDNHVVTLVWLDREGRWVFVDPSFNAWFADADGRALSPWELRAAFALGVEARCTLGVPFGGEPDRAEDRYRRYMAKNLFCMHSPVLTTFGSETLDEQQWICLAPVGFDLRRHDLLADTWRERAARSMGEWRPEYERYFAERREKITRGAFLYTSSLAAFADAPTALEVA